MNRACMIRRAGALMARGVSEASAPSAPSSHGLGARRVFSALALKSVDLNFGIPKDPHARSFGVHKHSLQRIAVKKLGEIVKVPLLKANPPLEIQRIWEEYHSETVSSVGHVLPAGEWLMLKERARRCPLFIYPVARPGSDADTRKGFFTLVGQWQENNLVFTFLDDFRTSPMTAQPWLAFSTYDDLVEEKGLALLRGEFTTRLDKEDVDRIFDSVRHFYLGDGYRHVESFNHSPDQFQFADVFPGIGF